MRWKLRVREPSIEDLLEDEMMTVVMQSAGTNAEALRALLRRVASRRDRRGRNEGTKALCCALA